MVITTASVAAGLGLKSALFPTPLATNGLTATGVSSVVIMTSSFAVMSSRKSRSLLKDTASLLVRFAVASLALVSSSPSLKLKLLYSPSSSPLSPEMFSSFTSKPSLVLLPSNSSSNPSLSSSAPTPVCAVIDPAVPRSAASCMPSPSESVSM